MSGTLPDMAVEEFANRLRRLRTKAGLTQAALAEKVGLSFQAVQGYEDQKNPTKPRRPNAIKLARAVGWEDVDEALRLLDYDPLDADERAEPSDPHRDRLNELWPYLTEQQRGLLVDLLASMIVPHTAASKGVIRRLAPGSGRLKLPGQRGDNGGSGSD